MGFFLQPLLHGDSLPRQPEPSGKGLSCWQGGLAGACCLPWAPEAGEAQPALTRTKSSRSSLLPRPLLWARTPRPVSVSQAWSRPGVGREAELTEMPPHWAQETGAPDHAHQLWPRPEPKP